MKIQLTGLVLLIALIQSGCVSVHREGDLKITKVEPIYTYTHNYRDQSTEFDLFCVIPIYQSE